MKGIYILLDYFFLIFHFVIVLFNLFGWIWKPTRKANLILLLLTAASWFGLGLIYGIGFCPFTEWHWKVLAQLGHRPSETSYMQYLLFRVAHIRTNPQLVDAVTLSCFIAALTCSLFTNLKDSWKKRQTPI